MKLCTQPQFLTDIIMLDGIPSKTKWKCSTFLHCIYFSYVSNTITSFFSSYCFTSVFTSVDVIFHKFLEPRSTLVLNKVFSWMFLSKRIHSLGGGGGGGCSHNELEIVIEYLTLGFTNQNIKQRGEPHETEFWRSSNAKMKCSNRYSSNSR